MQATKDILARLRDAGFRMTTARRAVLEALERSRAPLSVSEILDGLKRSKAAADKTTVYREVTFLMEQGLVSQVQFRDKVKRYELAGGHHHHLVCTNCGTVADVHLGGDLDAIEKKISRKSGFRIDDHNLEFFGLCADCRKS